MRFCAAQLLENSFVIASTKDEAEEFYARMSQDGLSDRRILPRLVDFHFNRQCHFDRRHVRISLLHAFIVQIALSLDMDYVTIFESDALPVHDWLSSFDSYMSAHEIPDDANIVVWGSLNYIDEYGAFLGGVYDGFGRIELHRIAGAHAYTVFKSGYEEYLRNYSSREQAICDEFRALVSNAYASCSSFFIQYRNADVCYKGKLVDPHNLDKFRTKK